MLGAHALCEHAGCISGHLLLFTITLIASVVTLPRCAPTTQAPQAAADFASKWVRSAYFLALALPLEAQQQWQQQPSASTSPATPAAAHILGSGNFAACTPSKIVAGVREGTPATPGQVHAHARVFACLCA